MTTSNALPLIRKLIGTRQPTLSPQDYQTLGLDPWKKADSTDEALRARALALFDELTLHLQQ